MKQFSFLSPTFFGLIIFSFFLTFFDLKCTSNNQSLVKVTGIELVTGKDFELPDFKKGLGDLGKNDSEEAEKPLKKESQHVPSSPLAMGILFMALLGIGIYFMPNERQKSIIAIVISIFGLGGLMYLGTQLENSMSEGQGKEMASIIKAETGIGYLLACILFLAAAIWNLFYLNIGLKNESVVPYSNETPPTDNWEQPHSTPEENEPNA
jgi:hypothetical protein